MSLLICPGSPGRPGVLFPSSGVTRRAAKECHGVARADPAAPAGPENRNVPFYRIDIQACQGVASGLSFVNRANGGHHVVDTES